MNAELIRSLHDIASAMWLDGHRNPSMQVRAAAFLLEHRHAPGQAAATTPAVGGLGGEASVLLSRILACSMSDPNAKRGPAAGKWTTINVPSWLVEQARECVAKR